MQSVVLAVMVIAAACGGGASDAKRPLGSGPSAVGSGTGGERQASPVLPPEGQAALDSGNAAYRRKDYAAALAAFERAARLAPEHAAPWFGIYIVAQARHDTKAADAALAEIRKRRD